MKDSAFIRVGEKQGFKKGQEIKFEKIAEFWKRHEIYENQNLGDYERIYPCLKEQKSRIAIYEKLHEAKPENFNGD
jgi:hypothetical protein